MKFDEAFKVLIGHEGGYVNHPKDPGGETKYGISKRSYPKVDIKNLTLDQAKAIYKRDFWDASGCEKVPNLVRFDLFDAAVNSGNRQAIKWLQTAVGVTSDGSFGPKTQAAANAANPAVTVARFNGARLLFMAGLGTWSTFGKGWARRVAENLTRAELK